MHLAETALFLTSVSRYLIQKANCEAWAAAGPESNQINLWVGRDSDEAKALSTRKR